MELRTSLLRHSRPALPDSLELPFWHSATGASIARPASFTGDKATQDAVEGADLLGDGIKRVGGSDQAIKQ
ncbi:hypothetical protein WJX75_003015 [Coccomyxa subellipsoidea]|uniref:Uncharacterized protein n=1 Tax=Coccomyxa subellipsoidea TaxID=248742 RepID=A0ABR2YLR0_9CHLO